MKVEPGLLLVVESAGIGDGEPDLGATLMRAFLGQLLESGTVPETAIFMSTGVFLTTDGSPVADQVRGLAEAGCAVSSCGTCLDYYGRRDRLIVGTAGNMRDAVRAMLDAAKTLRP
jgi:selenium metabolism protein YedF